MLLIPRLKFEDSEKCCLEGRQMGMVVVQIQFSRIIVLPCTMWDVRIRLLPVHIAA